MIQKKPIATPYSKADEKVRLDIIKSTYRQVFLDMILDSSQFEGHERLESSALQSHVRLLANKAVSEGMVAAENDVDWHAKQLGLRSIE